MTDKFIVGQRYHHFSCLDVDHIVLSAEKLAEGTLVELLAIHQRYDFIYGSEKAIIPEADENLWSPSSRNNEPAGERPYQTTVLPGAFIKARTRA